MFVWSIYTVPFQVGSDESILISKEQLWLNQGVIDVFGLSDYYGFPYFPYLVLGWLGKLLGGIDLYHQRLLHGIDGAVIVACCYVFFRVIGLRWLLAVTAAIYVGANHSFIAISRLAIKDNSALLFEVLGLTVLFHGFKRRCILTTYLGGLLSGFALYQYYPARITIIVWVTFLLLVALFRRSQLKLTDLLSLSVTFALGLALAGMPLLAASARMKPSDYLQYPKHTFLLCREGQDLEMLWTGEKTVAGAVMRNISNGLTVFDNAVTDQGCQYINPNHGFGDPLTGILIWLGVLVVLFFRRNQLASVLMLGGFAAEMFFFSFVLSQEPDYTRLLVILPFAGFFVATGIEALALIAREIASMSIKVQPRVVYYVIFVCANMAVVAVNLGIYSDYVRGGFEQGNELGATVRYVESRRGQPEHLFVISADTNFPYFRKDYPGEWITRLLPFAANAQLCKTLVPNDVAIVRLTPPFTIFMNGSLWKLKRNELLAMYPHAVEHHICQENQLVALEEPTVLPTSYRVHQSIEQYRDMLSVINDAIYMKQYDRAISLSLQTLHSPEAMLNGGKYKAEILRTLGSAYIDKENYGQAEEALLDAVKIRKETSGVRELGTADFAAALGSLYAREQKWADSEHWYRQAAEIRENARVTDLNTVVHGAGADYRGIAEALHGEGKVADAKNSFQKAIELYSAEHNGRVAAEIAQEMDKLQENVQHD